MNQDLKPGQVWTWVIADAPYDIDEVYLLLRQSASYGFSAATYPEECENLWEALNLQTGYIELITPFFTAGTWEMVE